MKPIYVILIIVGFLTPLIFMMIVPVILLKSSWWWFFGTLIFEFVLGIVIGLIYLIILLRRKPETKVKLDEKGARARAKRERAYDEDDPDNFIIQNTIPLNAGKDGAESNMIHFKGIGSEKSKRWDCVINLDEPKKASLWIADGDEDKIKEMIKSMAEHPAYEETVKTTTGKDAFGNPIVTQVGKRMTQTQKQEAEEKKKEEAVKDM